MKLEESGDRGVMSTTTHQCPKCRGHMEQGFVLDNTYGGRLVSHWSSGPPAKSFWTGTKTSDDKLIPIGCFRCSDCGFLEAYARLEFAAH
jgi:hypothetical protein